MGRRAERIWPVPQRARSQGRTVSIWSGRSTCSTACGLGFAACDEALCVARVRRVAVLEIAARHDGSL